MLEAAEAFKCVKKAMDELHQMNKTIEKIGRELEKIDTFMRIAEMDQELKCEMLEWFKDKNGKWSKEN